MIPGVEPGGRSLEKSSVRICMVQEDTGGLLGAEWSSMIGMQDIFDDQDANQRDQLLSDMGKFILDEMPTE